MLIQSFLDYLRHERNYSEKTIENYRVDLEQFQDFFHAEDGTLEWGMVDADIVRRWIVSLMDGGYTATSVNRKLSALRSFYKHLLRRDVVKVNPMAKSGQAVALLREGGRHGPVAGRHRLRRGL